MWLFAISLAAHGWIQGELAAAGPTSRVKSPSPAPYSMSTVADTDTNQLSTS